MSESLPTRWRKTTQSLAPPNHRPTGSGQYDIYPAFPCQSGVIEAGTMALVKSIAGQSVVMIDGEVSIFWKHLRLQLDQALKSLGIQTVWIDVLDAMHSERPINIDRAMENLYFNRSGDRIRQELVSLPSVIKQGED